LPVHLALNISFYQEKNYILYKLFYLSVLDKYP
jgi:hypothetical protein